MNFQQRTAQVDFAREQGIHDAYYHEIIVEVDSNTWTWKYRINEEPWKQCSITQPIIAPENGITRIFLKAREGQEIYCSTDGGHTIRRLPCRTDWHTDYHDFEFVIGNDWKLAIIRTIQFCLERTPWRTRSDNNQPIVYTGYVAISNDGGTGDLP